MRTSTLLTAAASLLLLAGGATADPAPRTITMTGQGEVKAVPDEADLSAGVTTAAKTAKEALAENSRAMNAVFDSLKRLGVADKQMQTANFSVEPQYQTCKPNTPCQPKIVGYQVSNTVEVSVDIDKAGAVLDALVASGSNQIGGISFAIRDPKALLRAARSAAAEDAIDRAETYAKAAGVTLGPVQSISEGGSYAPRPVMYRAMAGLAQEAAPPPPVAAGEQTVSASVTITWAIQ